jgi:hypothetical protein
MPRDCELQKEEKPKEKIYSFKFYSFSIIISRQRIVRATVSALSPFKVGQLFHPAESIE